VTENAEAVLSDEAAAIAIAPRPRRRWSWRSIHPAAALTTLGITCWVAVFGRLAMRHHTAYGTWSFDMGIYDQGYWLVSRFKPTFVTVRGLDFWGQHINLIAYLYAPFYWLGAGPTFLMATQALVLGLGAMPVYLIARDRLSAWYGAAFAAAFLLYPAIQFISWANYHPEALVITPFLFAWWAALRSKWTLYIVMLVLVLITREDAALAVTVLGAVLWIRQWRSKSSAAAPALSSVSSIASVSSISDVSTSIERGAAGDVVLGRTWTTWIPAGTLVLGAVWYALCTRVAIPHFNNGEQPFYINYFYQSWGNSMGEVVKNIARHPDRVISDATKPDRIRFYRDLVLPLGGLPLAGLGFIAMAAPQLLASVIGASPYARMILYQYTAMMIAPIFIATIEGYRRFIHPRPWRRWVIAWMLGCALVSNIAWSPSPIGARYGVWARDNSRVPLLKRAVALVPDDARLTATYSLLPHLSHRDVVYDWPNPWRQVSWGNHNENIPNPATVEYLVLDLHHVNASDRDLVDTLIGPGGEYQTLMNTDDVIVARRTRVGPTP